MEWININWIVKSDMALVFVDNVVERIYKIRRISLVVKTLRGS